MDKKINVMDIFIDKCMAKEALKTAVKGIASAPVTVIEMVTSDTVFRMATVPGLTKEVSEFDLILPGETTILEAADIKEKKYLQETKDRVFLKMFLRYMHKHQRRVYLLADTQEELTDFQSYMHKFYAGIRIVGMMDVTAPGRTDEMIVNAINGTEAACILSVLSSPLQEEFIIKNKMLLNVHIFMGMGKEIIPVCRNRMKSNRFSQFIIKRILQKEIEKGRKNGGN